MGKGRAPCCDKSKVKRGPWSPAEDLRLITFIQKNGHDNWRALPKQAGLLRCGKSCRLRWINYLRPDLKRGNFTIEEEETIIKLHNALGNKWSKIASYFPGRTDNEIKNVWNTHLKKRLSPTKNESKETSPTSSSTSSTSNMIEESNNTTIKDISRSSSFSSNNSSSLTNQDNDASIKSKSLDDDEDQGQMESLFELAQPLEEVNKPEIIPNNDIDGLNIPFETDSDFWNLLDGISETESELFQSNPVQSHEMENRKWFEYLENELGLGDIEDDHHEKCPTKESQPLIHEMSNQIQQDFQPWISSPTSIDNHLF